jgi:hypothetical protein
LFKLSIITLLSLSFVACLGGVEPLKEDPMDGGGTGRYASDGVFQPGSGTTDSKSDVQKLFGPPDGDALHLGAGGSVDVSFNDFLIYDSAGPDIKIHATIDPQEKASVYGSEDGADFEFITIIQSHDDTSFEVDITAGALSYILFLRVIDSKSGNGIEIDSIEVINPPQ